MISKEKLQRLLELASVFLKVGSIGFGGMPSIIAMIKFEVTDKRKWLTQDQFIDFFGATNLLPGPNTVEIATHVGYLQSGWWGFTIAGLCLVFPSALIAIALAILYNEFGSLPEVTPFLDGIKPVVLSLILVPVYKLGKTAIKHWSLAVIVIFVIPASIFGLNNIIVILLGGFLGMFWLHFYREFTTETPVNRPSENAKIRLPKTLIILLILLGGFLLIDILTTSEISLWKLSSFFLKVGSLLYGSGYVLIAFLQDLVDQFHWLTQQQLLDAIAIGQITPGPLISSVTFIGYLLLGLPGAIVGTISILLPAFLFSAALNSLVPQMRNFRWTCELLDAINVTSIALMASAFLTLSRTTLINWQTLLIALCACLINFRWKVNILLMIFVGAISGWILFRF
ncbi:MAG: chromate efflux transporter [Cyanobacteriota bacterium]|nr:chromate efflux transporter [Cyanobacteriota bacterium]